MTVWVARWRSGEKFFCTTARNFVITHVRYKLLSMPESICHPPAEARAYSRRSTDATPRDSCGAADVIVPIFVAEGRA